MKKLLALLCVLSMVLSFVACNGDDNGSGTPASATTTAANNTGNTPPTETPTDNNDNNNGTSKEILWVNGTHAVLTKLNRGDVSVFGGFEPSPEIKAEWIDSLDMSWGIDNKEELIYMIDSLTLGRHNPNFLEEAEEYGFTEMTEEEFFEELEHVEDEEDYLFFMTFIAYFLYGENAIMGWDMSRATQLCAQGYLAGYFTYEEAVEKALSVARVIQQTFDSWGDFWESYFYGYYYWSEDIDFLSERMDIYEALINDDNSPLNLDWNLSL
jgi:hypothetical protein